MWLDSVSFVGCQEFDKLAKTAPKVSLSSTIVKIEIGDPLSIHTCANIDCIVIIIYHY